MKIKKFSNCLLTLFFLLTFTTLQAQQKAINSNGEKVDLNFVDKSADQTVAGKKIFSNGLTVTNRPFLPPVLTQAQIDTLTSPTEGMIIYNSTVRKWQGFSVGNNDIINDGFAGTWTTDVATVTQEVVVPITGYITQIQFYVKSDSRFNLPFLDLFVAGNDGSNLQGSYSDNISGSPQWIVLNISPTAVTAGQLLSFTVNGMFLDRFNLGTNNSYSNGSAFSFGSLNGDDLMFKISISPSSSDPYWINMN